jgi:hypothetical protein
VKVSHHRDIDSASHPAPSKQRGGKVDQPAPTTEFAASAALSRKIANTAEVRPEQVARAKALISDPQYPNREVIRSVANRLADGMQSQESGE